MTNIFQCFYDNIVFAPFIFIEDPVDINGQRGVSSEAMSSRPFARVSQGGPVALMRGNKIDPYYLIVNVRVRYQTPDTLLQIYA